MTRIKSSEEITGVNEEITQILQEALEDSRCAVYCTPRGNYNIIVSISEIAAIKSDIDYYGIFISVLPGDILVWLAINSGNDIDITTSANIFHYDMTLNEIIEESCKRFGTCRNCHNYVGFEEIYRYSSKHNYCSACANTLAATIVTN